MASPARQILDPDGLQDKIQTLMAFKRHSLVHLHGRSIQWHLKNHLKTLESLENIIPVPVSLRPLLKLWLE